MNTTVAVSSALQQQVYSQSINKTKPIICLGHHLDELIIKKTLKLITSSRKIPNNRHKPRINSKKGSERANILSNHERPINDEIP